MNNKILKIHITCEENENITLLEISTFLYDLNLFYEISRLAVDRKYSEFEFTNFVYRRNGRPIEKNDRLEIKKIKYESPLEILLILSIVAVGAVPVLKCVTMIVGLVEKLSNWKLDRRKLEAEVKKLESENAIAQIRSIPQVLELIETQINESKAIAPQKPKSIKRRVSRTSNLPDSKSIERKIKKSKAGEYYINTEKRIIKSKIKLAKIDIEIEDE